jgi:hypothetical protein
VHRAELAVYPCLSESLPDPAEPRVGSSGSDRCASNRSRHRPNKTATTGLRSCTGEAGGRELDAAGRRFPTSATAHAQFYPLRTATSRITLTGQDGADKWLCNLDQAP